MDNRKLFITLCKDYNYLEPDIFKIDSRTNIYKDEYPNIYLDHKITDEEFDNAINTILTKIMQDNNRVVIVDLDMRNQALAPAKEMTIKEIEEKLGHKVKIID